jgi:hypothetical protein
MKKATPGLALTLHSGRHRDLTFPDSNYEETLNADAECFQPRRISTSSDLRLLLFNDDATSFPASLLEQVTIADRNALIKRDFDSVMEMFTAANCCAIPDIVVHLFTDPASLMRRIKDVWSARMRQNYNPRPAYFAISSTTQPSLVRYEIERLGGHFLHLFDVPTHFRREIDQIRLELRPVIRSLPRWLIVQEGYGPTLRAVVYLVGRHRAIRVGGSDRHAAALAAFIKHNGISRSIGAWQKVFADDVLFAPSGGGFDIPSRSGLKRYLRRDFPKYFQQAFDEQRSGHSADRVIECINPGTWATEYKVRGEWEVVRR